MMIMKDGRCLPTALFRVSLFCFVSLCLQHVWRHVTLSALLYMEIPSYVLHLTYVSSFLLDFIETGKYRGRQNNGKYQDWSEWVPLEQVKKNT